MSSAAGQPIDALDSPQLLLDLDVVDANARRLLQPLSRPAHRRARPFQVAEVFRAGPLPAAATG